MKFLKVKILAVILLIMINSAQAGTNSFLITVQSDNPGDSEDTEFTIPTIGSGYNYNVDCNNNGTFDETAITGDYTCDFALLNGAGTYQIRIRGNLGGLAGFPRIYFNNSGDKLKLISIDNWGTNPWLSMQGAFWGAGNMTVPAGDVPNLSNMTSMALMFNGAVLANPDTSMWDTSTISNMGVMFQNAIAANPDVSGWDTSNVTIMNFMFAGASSANPNLSHWDISNVTDMTNLLGGSGIHTTNYDTMLVNFNNQSPPISINLNNVPVVRCSQMAQTAYTNLTTVNGWTINDQGICTNSHPANDFVFKVDTTITGSTTNTQFEIKTSNSSTYHYNVDCDDENAGTNITTGETDDYTCNYTVPGTYTIRISDNNGDKTGFPYFDNISNDDVKKIIELKQWGQGIWTSMNSTFNGANEMVVSATDTPNFSQVTSMSSMFRGATLANPDTSQWDTTMGIDMSLMFRGATLAEPDTSSWNTINVQSMYSMFRGATSANPDTSQWDTSMITNMSFMFEEATSANPDTSQWDTSMVTNMSSMFRDATLAEPDTSSWNTINVQSMYSMFRGATSANPDTSQWDTSMVTNMSETFRDATSAEPDTSQWDTVMVNTMHSMFRGAILANPDTSSWNTTNVLTMRSMFRGATSANPNVSSWDITSVTAMNDFFSGVTLPTSDYDAMLIHFNSQALQTSVVFSGGDSKYCAITAHDNLENVTTGHGWIITDAGLDPLCDDIIFRNSFEISVVTFNASDKQFAFDFSLLDNIKLDTYPELIAIGLDNDQEKVIKIHIRKLTEQLQIRMSHFYQDEFDGEQWIGEQWQDIDNNKLTTISW